MTFRFQPLIFQGVKNDFSSHPNESPIHVDLGETELLVVQCGIRDVLVDSSNTWKVLGRRVNVLVGGFTHLKNISQIGSFRQVVVKIKNV